MNDIYHSLKKKNLVFYWTSLVLLVVLVLYPLLGGIMMSFVLPVTGAGADWADFNRQDLAGIRMVQVIGQVLLLCLPVLFLVGLQTGEKRLFSKKNLEFLGYGHRVSMSAVLLAVTGVLLLQPFIYVLVEGTGYFLSYLGEFGESILDNQERLQRFLMFLAGADSFGEFLAVVFVVAVIPSLCEEMFFRGYVQKNYMDSLSPTGGILLTGFVFGLFHMSPANLLPLTVMGWFIGYVYYKTQSLVVPIAVHFCNNFLSLVILQLQRENPDVTGESLIMSETIGWVILFVALSLLLFALVMRSFSRRFVVVRR
ncbi:CPBP family intramembrane glutamic endopeptidase [Prosthecochloris sp.]|uniref:CPBP family intramembrane glutamic endopeptidase n=1 Tax=Prosthecochloris sp. TaxID=290513 RepID=UPI0025DE2CD2|nr:CPBP family intramembrane glutamic endopeptidase [Prosthecochloris sp.]